MNIKSRFVIISVVIFSSIFVDVNHSITQQHDNQIINPSSEVIFPGDGAGNGPPLRYHDNGDGTFTDLNTQFMWERKDKSDTIHNVDRKYTWSNSGLEPDGTLFIEFIDQLNNTCFGDTNPDKTRCVYDWQCVGVGEEKCGHAGYRDWCIPDIKQLQTIVDYGKKAPAYSVGDSIGADDEEGGIFWSSTPFKEHNQAWGVAFRTGIINQHKKTHGNLARAVRPCDVEMSCEEKGSCRVFVANGSFGNALAGYGAQSYAAALCKQAAYTAGIDGVYQPLLETGRDGLSGNFTRSIVPYVRVDGTKIAENWDDLTSCNDATKTDQCLLAPINMNAKGEIINNDVWTGLNFSSSSGQQNCNMWTEMGVKGVIGNSSKTNHQWMESEIKKCDTENYIYCFEQ